MPVAGYSNTPLPKKLGIGEKMKLLLRHPPEDYFILLEKDLSGQLCKKGEKPDWIQLFAASKKIFEQSMQALQPVWKQNPSVIIWVSWYKKSSGMVTDLRENDIRNYALANGLVDIKVCAVNEQWSGLKLVVPLAKRKPILNC